MEMHTLTLDQLGDLGKLHNLPLQDLGLCPSHRSFSVIIIRVQLIHYRVAQRREDGRSGYVLGRHTDGTGLSPHRNP